MNACLFSHVGNSRENQEDNAFFDRQSYITPEKIKALSSSRQMYCFDIKDEWQTDFLFAVSDGMGGHSCGEIASYYTVKYLDTYYDQFLRFEKEELSREIIRLNSSVWEKSRESTDCSGMGATLCGLLVRGETLLGFHVGDSRIYTFSGGKLTQLSKDHTEGQRLLDLKLLSAVEVANFPHRKSLYKYIGMKTPPTAEVLCFAKDAPGQVVLLCTDGLSDVLSHDTLERLLSEKESLKSKGTKIMNEALAGNPGRGDNITFILVEL